MTRAAPLLMALAAVAMTSPVSAQDGAALYAQRCRSCHEGGAASRVPTREVIALLAPERIVQSLETGVMREQGETMTAAERLAVARYVSSLSAAAPAAAPAPARTCTTAPPLQLDASRDWNGWGVTLANDRFQRSPGFSAAQIPNLRLKWAFGFEGENAAATQPTIAGGRVFVGSGSGRVYSLDLQTGCVHWVFRAESRVRAATTIGPAGHGQAPSAAALAAFFGDGAANVYSLDAVTGALRWKRRVDDHRAARITGSPVLYDGRLYVPVSSGEEGTGAAATYECCTFRGSIVALDAATGDVIWKSYTIADAPKPTTRNRVGTQMHGPSGAAVWHAPTIDPSTRSLYVATGDSYSAPAAPTSDAIMAFDLATGAVKWAQQMTEGDVWNMSCGTADPSNCVDDAGPDFDFGQPPILISRPDGRRMLVVGQKSGKIHALDPDDRGRVLWSVQVAKGGVLGGFEWGSASDGERFYAPASDLVFKNPAQFARGGVVPTEGGGLFAVRVSDGALAWSTPAPPCTEPCSPAQPAPSALIPDAVFAGSLDGFLRAYSTRDGRILWSFDTARPFDTVNGVKASGGSIDVGGPAIADGMVLTTSGYGTWGGKPGNVLLAFGL